MIRSSAAADVASAMTTARRLAGMATREFASTMCARLGRRSLHPSTVSKWEHGATIPPADVLITAALVANVPIQVLFDDTPDGSEPTNRLQALEEQMNALSGRVAQLWAKVDLAGE